MMKFKPLTELYEWAWFQKLARPVRCEDSQGIVAYNDAGKIVAMAVFDGFTVDSCTAHVGITNPLVIRAGFLNEVFDHLFNTCDLKRVFGLVPSNNTKALKFDLKIGFTEVARIPDGFETGVDYAVVRLDKEDCRWIEHPVQKEMAHG
jgi:RimJ/RimL family protein N-acetyltransferase